MQQEKEEDQAFYKIKWFERNQYEKPLLNNGQVKMSTLT